MNGTMVIYNYIVNLNNVAWISTYETSTDGYTYKQTYYIEFVYTDNTRLTLKTYEKNEFDTWLKYLKGGK